MKKIILSMTFFVSFSTVAFAALPPLWQNVAELKSILNDRELGKHLKAGEEIVSIKKTDNGWLITTNKSKLPIDVNNEASKRPGPVRFKLEFQKTEPAKE